MRFASRCRMHGSATPAAREAAARREVSARAEVVLARLDVEPLDNPVEALMTVASEVIAVKNWLSGRFAEADSASQYMLSEMLGRALDRASRLLVELHKLDLEPRRQALAEWQALRVGDVIAGALADSGIDPTAPEVRATVRRHLERVAADGYEMRHPDEWGHEYRQRREAMS